jgi:hypothetical protein
MVLIGNAVGSHKNSQKHYPPPCHDPLRDQRTRQEYAQNSINDGVRQQIHAGE